VDVAAQHAPDDPFMADTLKRGGIANPSRIFDKTVASALDRDRAYELSGGIAVCVHCGMTAIGYVPFRQPVEMRPMTASRDASLSAPVTAPWWRGAVIYQIYPRSFADADGDGVGDLAGITARLDHVAKLGVDGIWISPFFTSPMRDFGYDVADYCDVDPIFGTLADFDALVARAHDLGLKVTIDQVYAHTSDLHPWFAQSRQGRDGDKADWYVWRDPKPDGTPPNNWQSVFGGPAWTWDARRRQYYMHTFLREQPQLNAHNPVVQDALLEAAKFWLDRGSTVSGSMRSTIRCSTRNCVITRRWRTTGVSARARSISRKRCSASRTPMSRCSWSVSASCATVTTRSSPWPRWAARARSR
jgi:hypothetical protein